MSSEEVKWQSRENELLDKIARLEDCIKDLKDEHLKTVENFSIDYSQQEIELEETREELESKGDEISALEDRVIDFENKVGELEQTIEELEEKLREMEEEANGEKEDLQEKICELEESESWLSDALDKVKVNISEQWWNANIED